MLSSSLLLSSNNKVCVNDSGSVILFIPGIGEVKSTGLSTSFPVSVPGTYTCNITCCVPYTHPFAKTQSDIIDKKNDTYKPRPNRVKVEKSDREATPEPEGGGDSGKDEVTAPTPAPVGDMMCPGFRARKCCKKM